MHDWQSNQREKKREMYLIKLELNMEGNIFNGGKWHVYNCDEKE